MFASDRFLKELQERNHNLITELMYRFATRFFFHARNRRMRHARVLVRKHRRTWRDPCVASTGQGRMMLINAARGLTKSFGERLHTCGAGQVGPTLPAELANRAKTLARDPRAHPNIAAIYVLRRSASLACGPKFRMGGHPSPTFSRVLEENEKDLQLSGLHSA